MITVNGNFLHHEPGYATINRTWKKGDAELVLLMEVRWIVSRPELKQDVERVALQRGPLVYCVEGADNNGKVILFFRMGQRSRLLFKRICWKA